MDAMQKQYLKACVFAIYLASIESSLDCLRKTGADFMDVNRIPKNQKSWFDPASWWKLHPR